MFWMRNNKTYPPFTSRIQPSAISMLALPYSTSYVSTLRILCSELSSSESNSTPLLLSTSSQASPAAALLPLAFIHSAFAIAAVWVHHNFENLDNPPGIDHVEFWAFTATPYYFMTPIDRLSSLGIYLTTNGRWWRIQTKISTM